MKLEMTLTKNTVVASASMHPYAFLKAKLLAEKFGGSVCTTDLQARFKATFKSAKKAQKFVTEWNAQYEQAQAAKQITEKVTETLIKATLKRRVRKPVPAKGNGVDFGKVSGKTKSERNKSAHALIVSTGVKSGTEEYKSLWTKWTEVR